MEFRLARAGEEAKIAQIHNTGYAEYIRGLHTLYGWREIGTQDVELWLNDQKSEVWVTLIDSRIAGYVQTLRVINHGLVDIEVLWIAPTPKWDFAQSNLVVHPEYQRQGVATHMLGEITRLCANSDTHLIQALTFSDNTPAERLLQTTGFTQHDVLVYEQFSYTQSLGNSSVYVSLSLKEYQPRRSTNDAVTIRPASREDAEALAKIHRANVWWNEAAWTVDWNRDYASGRHGHHVYVAELNGKVVAAMDFLDRGTIGIAGVLPECQNRGIGSTLFSSLLGTMKERGIETAFADSGLTQKEAISMYRRFGFREERWQNLWTLQLKENTKETSRE